MLAELGRMDRSMMLFLGGVAVILALFVQAMSVLQDSEPVRASASRAAAKGQCVCVCVCVCMCERERPAPHGQC